MAIDDRAKALILDFVDRHYGGMITEVWLTGSRATGTARPESGWDVIAFSPHAPFRREDLFQHACIEEIAPGMVIELVVAHPDHWDDDRRYIADLRAFGIRLR